MLHDQMKSIKLLGIIVFIIGSVMGTLRMQKVIVPPYRLHDENATLECLFELGRDRLYSVKWYKDNEEFYRFHPKDRPQIHTHRVEGIHVIMEGSDQKFVTLGKLDLRSTGAYRCEVSAEKPSFASVHGEGRMTVIHLPEKGPQIEGKTQDEYEIGDNLALNCTSAKSFPPAKLSWYINDNLIDHGVTPIEPRNRRGALIASPRLESSISSLNITLEPPHFNDNGEAKVKCVASMTLDWRHGDERSVHNSRKTSTDIKSTSFSVSSPIFQDDREASLLVRGSGHTTEPSLWTFGVLAVISVCHHFVTNTCFSTSLLAHHSIQSGSHR